MRTFSPPLPEEESLPQPVRRAAAARPATAAVNPLREVVSGMGGMSFRSDRRRWLGGGRAAVLVVDGVPHAVAQGGELRAEAELLVTRAVPADVDDVVH